MKACAAQNPASFPPTLAGECTIRPRNDKPMPDPPQAQSMQSTVPLRYRRSFKQNLSFVFGPGFTAGSSTIGSEGR